jgi:hypothetical protein
MNTTSFPASTSTPATSIDEVIRQLTAIVEWSKDSVNWEDAQAFIAKRTT